jgi:hypothetical protein
MMQCAIFIGNDRDLMGSVGYVHQVSDDTAVFECSGIVKLCSKADFTMADTIGRRNQILELSETVGYSK